MKINFKLVAENYQHSYAPLLPNHSAYYIWKLLYVLESIFSQSSLGPYNTQTNTYEKKQTMGNKK